MHLKDKKLKVKHEDTLAVATYSKKCMLMKFKDRDGHYGYCLVPCTYIPKCSEWAVDTWKKLRQITKRVPIPEMMEELSNGISLGWVNKLGSVFISVQHLELLSLVNYGACFPYCPGRSLFVWLGGCDVGVVRWCGYMDVAS